MSDKRVLQIPARPLASSAPASLLKRDSPLNPIPNNSRQMSFTREETMEKAKTLRNFCGLPNPQRYDSIETTLRKSRGSKLEMKNPSNDSIKKQSDDPLIRTNKIEEYCSINHDIVKSDEIELSMHTKIANALATMAHNPKITTHFSTNGGFSALFKLINDSNDTKIHHTCLISITELSENQENILPIIEFGMLSHSNHMLRIAKNDNRIEISKIICNLACTQTSGLVESMIDQGLLSILNSIILNSESQEVAQFSFIAIGNMAKNVDATNAAIVLRLFSLGIKRLNIEENYTNALICMKLLSDLSRIYVFATIMCEEMTVPYAFQISEIHTTPEILAYLTEIILNLSFHRKNLRELANVRLANLLPNIFKIDDDEVAHVTPSASGNLLIAIGNMLSGNYFFDKICYEDQMYLISNGLFSRNNSKRFIGVAFCISQLICYEACSQLLVKCNIISITVDHLAAVEPHSNCCELLWIIIANLSQHADFLPKMVDHVSTLVNIALAEISVKDIHNAALNPLALFLYNLSVNNFVLRELGEAQVEKLIRAIKILIETVVDFESTLLSALANIAFNFPKTRKMLLENGVVSLFYDDRKDEGSFAVNYKFAMILNIISIQDDCYPRLYDFAAHNIL